MKRRLLAAGNWKMNGSAAMAAELVAGLAGVVRETGADVAVFPSFPFLAHALKAADDVVVVGGQNLSQHEKGAFTGEVSGRMLRELGCRMVLVGHSERRSMYAEDNHLVAAKFVVAQAMGLTPVLCVGETLEEREAGRTLEIVGRQVSAVIKAAGIAAFEDALIAYEPVWAIGTGKTATPDQAQDMHAAIREQVAAEDATIAGRLRILYGGSVKGSNASELFAMPDVDGGLVGGASLTLDDFAPICAAAAELS